MTGGASVFGPATQPVANQAPRRGPDQVVLQSREIVFAQASPINAETTGDQSQWWPHTQIRIVQVLLVSKGPVINAGTITVSLKNRALATVFSRTIAVTGNNILKYDVDLVLAEDALSAVTDWVSGGDIDGVSVTCRYIESFITT